MINYENALPRVEAFKASEGSRTSRGREWRVNFIANHRFDGVLQGFSLGGAVRWRSADTIGYHGKPNPLAPESDLLVEDVNRPLRGAEDFAVDGWINYEREIEIANKK